MKYIKAFRNKGKDDTNVVTNTRVMTREKAEELFDHIVNTFDNDKLSRYDSGPWGYYFRYDNMIIGQKSIEMDRVFYTLPIDIQDGIVDFLETKGKGTIRETPYSG